AALNRAVAACHQAGGGTVVLNAGTFIVSGTSDQSDGAVRLLDGVSIKGAGMGATTLTVKPGSTNDINGVIRTPFGQETENVGVFDLTIDGNRDAAGGKVNGFFCGPRPGATLTDRNVTLERVEIKDCSGYGFDPHERTINLTIANSVAHGNGLDGFVADFMIDSVFRDNIAYNNDRHGFNVTTSTTNFRLENNTAYRNGGSGIEIQRGSENIPWPTGIAVVGGRYYENARAGIEVKLASNVTVTGAEIDHNARQGVLIWGASGVTVDGNRIHNNSQAGQALFDEVNLRAFADPTTGTTYGAVDNRILNNDIDAAPPVQARYGIREEADASARTTLSGNTIDGTAAGDTWIDGRIGDDNGGTTGPAPVPGTSTGTSGADSLSGTAGNDSIAGLGGNDTLQGLGGDDTLDGGSGSDSLVGGAGNDTYFVNTSTDVVVEAAGGGTDSVVSQFTHTLAANVENLTVTAEYSVDSTGVRRNVNATGNDLANVVAGSIGANLVRGLGGADTLDGGAGADTLDGGLGADRLTGGAGDDLFDLDKGAANGDVVVDFATGDRIDLSSYGSGATLSQALSGTTLTATLTYTGGAESFTVLNLGRELAAADLVFTGTYGGGSAPPPPPPPPPPPSGDVVLTGTSGADSLTGGDGNDSLSGGGSNDTINGGAGNDTLDGGAGSDSMTGGAGNDVFIVNSSTDVTVEAAGGGTDTIRSLYTRTLVDNVENLELTGTGAINGYGNTAANALTGGSGANKLYGRDGNDTMAGGAGNDTVAGEAGADRLDGGAGADLLTGGAGNDVFVFARGEAAGDRVSDFVGNGANAGDALQFTGYGSGSFVHRGSGLWAIRAADGTEETITLTGVTALDPSDFAFV
ncbi:MAG TPA: right-handed parallel beta-helix repeat-containing protein, partial [Azospirillaceae bacterium]|nr:right-handed parallel beta-helix repeat-containing protein [Azospirillaceae bacterium]